MSISVRDFYDEQGEKGQIASLMIDAIDDSNCEYEIALKLSKGELPELADEIRNAANSLKEVKIMAKQIRDNHDRSSLKSSDEYKKISPRLKQLYDEEVSKIDGHISRKRTSAIVKYVLLAYLKEQNFQEQAFEDLKQLVRLHYDVDVKWSETPFLKDADWTIVDEP